MKQKIILSGILSLSLSVLAQENSVEKFPSKDVNWQTQNVSRKVMGTNVDKAYEKLLVDKAPKKKIIVAILDGGVDAQHEDLKSIIWVNKNEIPNNGIDDDNNGYIDDVHGWNFLGNDELESIEKETLEVLRIYRKLKTKYDGVPESKIILADKKEYELYIKVKEEVEKELNSANAQMKGVASLQSQTSKVFEAVDLLAGKKVNSIEEFKAIKTKDKTEKQLVDAAIKLTNQGYGRERLSKYMDYLKDQVEYNYNIDFDARGEIIGDDVNSISNKGYGNNDVKGPDAFHGTFCAGIVAAVRGNNLGVDGIGNSVEIMCLRAVPNGDEYDKDIALGIRYAVDNGAQIINMSFGKSYSPEKYLVDEAIKYAESKGVLLVHAAGNSSLNLDISDNFPTDKMDDNTIASNVLTIGASSIATKKTIPTDFSNYGKKEVDLFAPGKDIVSTVPDNKYDQGDGTSFAAPVVSGVAALVWSYYPELTYLQLKEILMKSVTDKSKKKVVVPGGDKKSKQEFKELSITGGVVNAYEALLLADQMVK